MTLKYPVLLEVRNIPFPCILKSQHQERVKISSHFLAFRNLSFFFWVNFSMSSWDPGCLMSLPHSQSLCSSKYPEKGGPVLWLLEAAAICFVSQDFLKHVLYLAMLPHSKSPGCPLNPLRQLYDCWRFLCLTGHFRSALRLYLLLKADSYPL